jgi:hypothetical protein
VSMQRWDPRGKIVGGTGKSVALELGPGVPNSGWAVESLNSGPSRLPPPLSSQCSTYTLKASYISSSLSRGLLVTLNSILPLRL